MNAPSARALTWFLVALSLVTALGMATQVIALRTRPYLGLSERGTTVAVVDPGGPAHRAGLRSGDRLLSIDGREVGAFADPSAYLRSQSPAHVFELRIRRGAQELPLSLPAEQLPASEYAWNLATAAVALLSLLTATIVVTRRHSTLTWVFYGICLALAVLIFRPWVPNTPGASRALSLAVQLFSILLPGLLLHFFLLFPYERQALATRPWLLALVYGPGALGFAAALFAAPLAQALDIDTATVDTAIGFGSGIYMLVLVALSIFLFFQTYLSSPLPSVRRKLKVTLWGTILGLCPLALVLLLHLVWPSLHLPGDRFAVLAVAFLPASFGYAIVRHGVFDIEFMVQRGLLYSALTTLFALAYFLLYFLLRGLLAHYPSWREQVGSALFVLFILIGLSPLRSRIQARLDRWIYPDRYDTPRALRESALALRDAKTAEEVGTAVLGAARAILGVETAAFFRFQTREESFVLGNRLGVDGDARRGYRLGRILAEPLFRAREPMRRAELEAELPFGFLPSADLETLNAFATEVLIPLAAGPRWLGIVALGGRAYREVYSAPDLMLLEGLQAQAALALENAAFAQESRGREDHHREMEMARSLQQQLLPHVLPRFVAFDMAARNIPCHEVGGDYYDCVSLNGGSPERGVMLAIGDVSGKGVPAALLMANLQAWFRVDVHDGLDPAEQLSALNRRFCALGRPDAFISFFCARLDPERRRLRYANAGHPPPILLRAAGAVDRLERGGLLLGIRHEERYEGGDVALEPGDLLLFFTDGVVERGGADARFGEAELEAFAARHRHLGAEDLLERVLAELARVGGGEHDDDTTLLVLKSL